MCLSQWIKVYEKNENCNSGKKIEEWNRERAMKTHFRIVYYSMVDNRILIFVNLRTDVVNCTLGDYFSSMIRSSSKIYLSQSTSIKLYIYKTEHCSLLIIELLKIVSTVFLE